MANDIDPQDVEAFLHAHPNFLQDRPGLLAVLNLPHGGEGAVSLVERQVSVLRERNITSRQKLNALSEIGQENDRLLEATRKSILALLGAQDREALSRLWTEQLRDTFQARQALSSGWTVTRQSFQSLVNSSGRVSAFRRAAAPGNGSAIQY